jgi:hypothetical protein
MVREEYKLYIYNYKTLYDILNNLQEKVAPSNSHQKKELIDKWLALYKPRKGLDVSHWLLK